MCVCVGGCGCMGVCGCVRVILHLYMYIVCAYTYVYPVYVRADSGDSPFHAGTPACPAQHLKNGKQ